MQFPGISLVGYNTKEDPFVILNALWKINLHVWKKNYKLEWFRNDGSLQKGYTTAVSFD